MAVLISSLTSADSIYLHCYTIEKPLQLKKHFLRKVDLGDDNSQHQIN
jgi:hypothetical protein